jgi:hypothetical protein
MQLFLPSDVDVPSAWVAAMNDPLIRRVKFSSIADARRVLDTIQFGIATEGPRESTRTKAHFFDVYQQLDAQTAPADAAPIDRDQRHHAAAYAAAAAALGVDMIVSSAITVGRPDVADNDLVASVTPDEAVAVFGHYLRMTANPIIDVRRGQLASGTWESTESTATIENFYDWGVVSDMPYFDVAPLIAENLGDTATVTALKSIRVRLARAARAFDDMLAALSNPMTGTGGPDVVETAAEAFDRQLLYLAATFDIYGRRFPLLIDATRDPTKYRQSLDGKGYVKNHLEKEYADTDYGMSDVKRLHVYAGVCKVLRNHIHDGILPVDQHPGRAYGNSMNIALNLSSYPVLTSE